MPYLGSSIADIAVIGDYPDNYGNSGWNATSLALSKHGIVATSCFFGTLTETRPPEDDIDEWISTRKTCPGAGWVNKSGMWFHPTLAAGCRKMEEALRSVNPKLVILLGKAPLAWFCGQAKIASWRGSRLTPAAYPFTVLPTIHPRTLIKQPDQDFIFKLDLKRAVRIYQHEQVPRNYNFIIQPTFEQVTQTLLGLLAKADSGRINLSGDLETRAGHIACFGIAWDAENAICIPHLVINDTNPFYWSEADESVIVTLYAQLFHHPNITWVGQNYLYDCQYFWRHWGILPLSVRDTMIGHHSLHSNIRKGLDFLSSMYAQDHVYWKDEIKEWDPKIGERQYWTYNCKDACITSEIDQVIEADAFEMENGKPLRLQHFEFQQSLFFPVLRIMNRGIRLDTAQRGTWNVITETGTGLKGELVQAQIDRQAKLNAVVGHELNPRSPAQLLKFFYKDLGLPGIQALGTETLSTNSPTLAQIAEKEPLLKPLCQLIVELRSIGVFLGTFIDAKLDSDGRMRCSFSVAGPTSYRFSSSENAFGSGMNLQNIPVAEKQKIKDKDYIKLPNIRKLFIPDEGYEFWDMDLDRADLQVVVWEADDTDMKKALRLGLDMHCVNACDVFNIKGIPYDELQESHPNYKDHRSRIGEANRGKTKAGVHATNYGVGDRKLAQALGITVHEASIFRAKWFAAHPGIRRWHTRTEQSVSQRGYIENKFGARLYNFGRFNLPEFLGWVPQSTVAGVINRALVNLDKAYEDGYSPVQLLGQVHDSLFGQYPINLRLASLNCLNNHSRVTIPYDDPLIIPVGIKTSTKSWGDCK
jgi:DNA polymerase I-like protein with 3'-5' exonuclease and polymerase domains